MKKITVLLGTLIIISLIGIVLSNIKYSTFLNHALKDWSDNGYDFKIAKENYLLNSKKLPKNILDQMQNDQKNGQKSFSEDALDLKYLNDEQRETFFWVQDNQIQNSKGKIIKWWDKNDRWYGTKISVSNQQIAQVKKALTYEKKKLTDEGWYQTRKSKSSWNFYKENLGHFLDVTKITDGDTMKFSGLTGLNLLEPLSNITTARSDNVRALVVDTDETFWSRYSLHQNKEDANKYLPTRLGYVQKAVAQITKEIYKNQKWLIVPVSVDKYNRTLSLIFTPDGIPWHKFLCECYCAGIYKNENQKPVFKKRNNYLMIQWWIIDFWLDRAIIIPATKEKGYETGDVSNSKLYILKKLSYFLSLMPSSKN